MNPPQIVAPPITGDWRPQIRGRINRLLAEAHAAGLAGADALAYLDAHDLRLAPHRQYQLWLKERRLARIALGLLAAPLPTARPGPPVAENQLALELEDSQ